MLLIINSPIGHRMQKIWYEILCVCVCVSRACTLQSSKHSKKIWYEIFCVWAKLALDRFKKKIIFWSCMCSCDLECPSLYFWRRCVTDFLCSCSFVRVFVWLTLKPLLNWLTFVKKNMQVFIFHLEWLWVHIFLFVLEYSLIMQMFKWPIMSLFGLIKVNRGYKD